MALRQRLRHIPGVVWAAVLATGYGLLWSAAVEGTMPTASPSREILQGCGAALAILALFIVLRQRPYICFAVTVAGVLCAASIPGLWGKGLSLMLMVAAYHLGRRTSIVPALALTIVAVIAQVGLATWQWRVQLAEVAGPDSESARSVLSVVLGFLTSAITNILVPAIGGAVVRHEVAEAEQVQRQAAEARAVADAAVVRALRSDRERLARELHDLAAHHSTAAVITARAARKVNSQDPAAGGALIDDVVAETRAAQQSLRQMVRVLHDPDDAVPLGPQPSLAEIPTLVARAQQRNPDIVLDMDEPPVGAVDDSTALAAHRIVQESLTNAERYAPGAPVTVSISTEEGWLVVQVVNGRSSRQVEHEDLGMQQGIVGMRRRAELLGGTVEAGPHGRGWRVLAELPLRPGLEES